MQVLTHNRDVCSLQIQTQYRTGILDPLQVQRQSRNFVIWGPGANIDYGAPFFSTKRSTGLLFTVQGSLRFFGVFRRLRAIEIDILQHLYMLCVALVLTSSLTGSASAVVEPSLLRAAFSYVSD